MAAVVLLARRIGGKAVVRAGSQGGSDEIGVGRGREIAVQLPQTLEGDVSEESGRVRGRGCEMVFALLIWWLAVKSSPHKDPAGPKLRS